MRWRIVFGAIILFALHWFAHEAKAQDRTFTITIPEGQLNYIGKVIGRQPYEEVRPILDNIQAQVSAQLTREREAERERLKSEFAKEDKQP